MSNKEAKEKLQKEAIFFKNNEFRVWQNDGKVFAQACSTGEFYGYVFEVDFDKKTLTPVF